MYYVSDQKPAFTMNSRHPDKRIISAWIDKDVFEAFRSHCEGKGVTMTSLIDKMIDRELSRAAKSKAKKA